MSGSAMEVIATVSRTKASAAPAQAATDCATAILDVGCRRTAGK